MILYFLYKTIFIFFLNYHFNYFTYFFNIDFNKASKSGSTSNEITEKTEISKTLNVYENVEAESKKASKKIISTDSIGSPTLTEGLCFVFCFYIICGIVKKKINIIL